LPAFCFGRPNRLDFLVKNYIATALPNYYFRLASFLNYFNVLLLNDLPCQRKKAEAPRRFSPLAAFG
jgi:hypothetical protein